VAVELDSSLERIDWAEAKVDPAGDDFDNGRSPEALRRSFDRSQHVASARDGGRVVGMARLRMPMEQVPGQHIGLQTDEAQAPYASLGFGPRPDLMSTVVGRRLDNDANR
jgi:hypothetical protein